MKYLRKPKPSPFEFYKLLDSSKNYKTFWVNLFWYLEPMGKFDMLWTLFGSQTQNPSFLGNICLMLIEYWLRKP